MVKNANGALAAAQSTTPSFAPIRTRKIYEEVSSAIRQKLIDKELKVGDRLPSERELTQMFGVSRTAVREAIRSLENEGIVTLKLGAKGGAFITNDTAGQVIQSFNNLLDFGGVTLAELLDARIAVMEAVVARAATRASPDDIAELRENITQTLALDRDTEYPARVLKAWEFNVLVARISGNSVLATITEAMSMVIRPFLVKVEPGPHEMVIRSRRDLVSRIESGDAEGAVAVVRSSMRTLNQHLLDAEQRWSSAGRSRSV